MWEGEAIFEGLRAHGAMKVDADQLPDISLVGANPISLDAPGWPPMRPNDSPKQSKPIVGYLRPIGRLSLSFRGMCRTLLCRKDVNIGAQHTLEGPRLDRHTPIFLAFERIQALQVRRQLFGFEYLNSNGVSGVV